MPGEVFARGKHPILAQWMSRKSTRVAMLLGALLIVSIAVNAWIILAGTGP